MDGDDVKGLRDQSLSLEYSCLNNSLILWTKNRINANLLLSMKTKLDTQLGLLNNDAIYPLGFHFQNKDSIDWD